MKKPHFRFKAGVWSCALRDSGGCWWAGYGYSVRDAWAEYTLQRSTFRCGIYKEAA